MFPLVVFGVLFAWPALERRFTGDRRRHDLLDRPRDHPTRTAIGAAFLSWVVIIFAVGSTDRIFYRLHISYTAQIHFWRAGIWVLPIIVSSSPAAPAVRCSAARPTRCAAGRARSSPATRTDTPNVQPSQTAAPQPPEPPVGTVPGHDYPSPPPQRVPSDD